ncbi:MAG: hypothetical protein P8046_01360 [Anaerolineales bacterium]
MLGKWFDAGAKDLQRGCLYQFIAAVTGIPIIIFLVVIPFKFAASPEVSAGEFLFIVVLPATLFLVLTIGGGWAAALLYIQQQAAWVDKIFTGFSLKASRLNITGRQYHGKIQGREVDVLYSRGPILTVYVSIGVMTRLSVSDSEDIIRGIANIFHQKPISLQEEGLTIYAHEAAWAQGFLAVSPVRELLKGLLFEQHPFLVRQVLIIPGRLMLRYYRSKQGADFEFSAEQASRWMDELLQLAAFAEAQPTPQKTIPVSEIHEQARIKSNDSLGWVIAGVIFMLTILALGLSMGAIFLFWGGI